MLFFPQKTQQLHCRHCRKIISFLSQHLATLSQNFEIFELYFNSVPLKIVFIKYRYKGSSFDLLQQCLFQTFVYFRYTSTFSWKLFKSTCRVSKYWCLISVVYSFSQKCLRLVSKLPLHFLNYDNFYQSLDTFSSLRL